MKDVVSKLKAASLEELEEIRRLCEGEIRARASSGPVSRISTYSDGASRGNPGAAGIGALLFDESGMKILQDFQFIGRATNNEAEYRALLLALDRAGELTRGRVACYMDSELVVRQLNGQYALKSERMLAFSRAVRDRVQRFEGVSFTHLPREHPRMRLADGLANRAIDEIKTKPVL